MIQIPQSTIDQFIHTGVTEELPAKAFVLAPSQKKKWAELVQKFATDSQRKTYLENGPRDLTVLNSEKGPVWILIKRTPEGPFSHSGALEESDYSWYRDQGGALFSLIKNSGYSEVGLELLAMNEEMTHGLFVGFELAGYNFKENYFKAEKKQFKIFTKLDRKILFESMTLGRSINIGRHLVNLPPNIAHPESLTEFAVKTFKGRKNMSLDVWDMKRLAKEKMGLLIGVGQGSGSQPSLVHFKYRPRSGKKPIAFVGKGITFDTGGLDIKPSSGMRLMKKDMGGAAALFGLAWWLSESNYKHPVDIYLALAENSVDAKSFRPSDVLISRSGQSVEIHNTDAEGRLVLADALDVAVTQKGKDEPESVIDVATLTGAIKVALGTEISGLFSNDDKLASALTKAGQSRGELTWRMPLFSRYTATFSTPFADMVNAVDGFAGPITAALFLEKFVKQKSWAHFDIYAWNDKATGALQFAGGNGQTVQTFTKFLLDRQ